MHFDELLQDHVGEMGKYQWMMTFLLATAQSVPLSWYTMGVVFLAAVPDHWCAVPALDQFNLTEQQSKEMSIPVEDTDEDGNPVYASCSMYDRNYDTWTTPAPPTAGVNYSSVYCEYGWDYSQEVYTRTVVTDLDLVCDKDFLLATASSIYMAGFLFGVISIGAISDKVGRKKTFIVATILLQIASVALPFIQSYWAYCTLRFMQGFFGLGAYTTGFVLIMEMAGPDRRVHAGMVPHWTWTTGYILFTIPAYFLRDWRTLALVTSCIGCLQFCIFFVLPESPRWLYNMQRSEEADPIMRKIAKVNGTRVPDPLVVSVKILDKKATVFDLFKYPNIRLITFVLLWLWCVSSMVYYGLSLSSSSMGSNNFVSFGMSALAEYPAHIYCHFVLHYWGRRLPIAVTLLVGGTCLFATIPVPESLFWLSFALGMVGKFCIAAVFNMAYNLSAEVYPTAVRQVGLSAGSMSGRIGGIAAPYIAYLGKYGSWIPSTFFGLCCVSAGLLAFLLPETKGLPMPDTLEAGEAMLKRGVKHDKMSEVEKQPAYDNIGYDETISIHL